jgi:predicted DsbA family dithiol-disulfide isomerase
MRTVRVDIWSDIACPWCWLGKRHLDVAAAELERENAMKVDVRWRAFELDPSANKQPIPDFHYASFLAAKYGKSVAEAQAMLDHMAALGAASGLVYRFERVQRTSTFDAHRLLALAGGRGVQSDLAERLFVAYMNEGRCISDRETLLELAAEVGLDAEEVRAMLATDDYTRAIRADEAEAARRGIRGVPGFVIEGRHAFSGAQPADVLAEALRDALAEMQTAEASSAADACSPSSATPRRG